MNAFEGAAPLRVDLAYAREDNLLFGERIYRPGAQLWLYDDLAHVVLAASRRAYARHGLWLVLHDGLRTVGAQQKMLRAQRVRDNPQWLEEPRLLSPPGAGGHPRGMAVDVSLEDEEGNALDMGTPFDFLAADPSPERNPAHRAYAGLSPEALKNRAILDDAMTGAARELNVELFPLPQEWWDYRLPKEFYERFAPLADRDLPEPMRMT